MNHQFHTLYTEATDVMGYNVSLTICESRTDARELVSEIGDDINRSSIMFCFQLTLDSQNINIFFTMNLDLSAFMYSF